MPAVTSTRQEFGDVRGREGTLHHGRRHELPHPLDGRAHLPRSRHLPRWACSTPEPPRAASRTVGWSPAKARTSPRVISPRSPEPARAGPAQAPGPGPASAQEGWTEAAPPAPGQWQPRPTDGRSGNRCPPPTWTLLAVPAVDPQSAAEQHCAARRVGRLERLRIGAIPHQRRNPRFGRGGGCQASRSAAEPAASRRRYGTACWSATSKAMMTSPTSTMVPGSWAMAVTTPA